MFYPKKLTSSASFSPSIRISLRLKIHQAQAKNFCRVLDIRVSEIVKAYMRQSPLIRGVEVGLDMLRLEDLHLEFLHLRCDAVLGGVAEDQAFFYGAVQGIVKHQVQAADGGAAEAWIAVAAFLRLVRPLSISSL